MPIPARALPDQETIREAFEYDAETGVVRWKIRAANRIHVGDLVGTRHPSSLDVKWLGKSWRVSRLIWKLVHNEEPEAIDHINNNFYDNRLINLRAATNAENSWNQRVKKTRSGLKGAWFNKSKGKWFTRVTTNGHRFEYGGFATAEEAHAVYCVEAQRRHDQFFNAGYRA